MPDGRAAAPPRDVRSRRWRRVDPAPAAIVGIGFVLRLAWLFQPIRYDEAVTFLHFVREGFVAVVSRYDVPNNHVMHTILVYGCTLLTSREWAIRLPAFVAGVLVVPVAHAVGRRLHGGRAALFGAALVACAPHLIEYSTNARGYSMVTLFALLQILLADRIVRAARHADLAAFAVVTALGLFTVPTMLYPTAVTLAWAGLVAGAGPTPWRSLLRRLPGYVVLTVVLTAAAYAPILLHEHGWTNLTGNRWVRPLESFDAWRQALAGLGGGVASEWSPTPGAPVFAAVVGLALVGIIAGVFRRRDPRAGWTAVACVVCVGLMGAQRVVPFVRVMGFALPMLLLAAGAGVSTVVARRPRAFGRSATVAACLGLAAYVVVARLPDRAGAFDKFPQGRQVAAFLSSRVGPAGDAVAFGVVPSACVRYYAFRTGAAAMTYRAGAARLWVVTRADQPPGDVLTSNGLRPADFGAPSPVDVSGVAGVYEIVPKFGRTPRPDRRQKRPDHTAALVGTCEPSTEINFTINELKTKNI